jgi:hypothetical protein
VSSEWLIVSFSLYFTHFSPLTIQLNQPINYYHNTTVLSKYRVLTGACYIEICCIKFIKTMKKFKIIPISKVYAQKIRSTMHDDFGHEVTEKIATGAGPCRVSLKPFIKGVHKRLLLTHSPFEVDNAYNQPGPVFINSDEVEEYADIYCFPGEIKADKVSFPLTLIGYNKNQQMVLSKLVGDADVDEVINEIFDLQDNVEYLHARNAQACCFICKIERVKY